MHFLIVLCNFGAIIQDFFFWFALGIVSLSAYLKRKYLVVSEFVYLLK